MRLKRIFLSVVLTSAVLLAGCGGNGDSGKNKEVEDGKGDEEAVQTLLDKIDMKKWQYNQDTDVYWQVGISYCENPADETYETLGIYVPGAYMSGTENEDGTHDFKDGKEGGDMRGKPGDKGEMDGDKADFDKGGRPDFDGELPKPDGVEGEDYYERDRIDRNDTAGGISLSGTYDTVQDYIDALNAETKWVTYDSKTNSATITSKRQMSLLIGESVQVSIRAIRH